MRCLRQILPLLALALASAAPAIAATAEEPHGSSLFWPLFNFAILVVALVYFLRKPLQSYLATRRSAIESELAQAAEMKREAEERYAKWHRRVVDLDADLAQIRATARERAETERAHILADAQASAERIRRDARAAVEQELRRAREELRQEASDLAIELAAGILREQVNEGDRERLLDEFITRIESAPGAVREGR